MMTQQQIFTNEDNNSTKIFKFDEVTTCPMCKHAIKPHILHGVYFNERDDEVSLSIHYLCKACSTPFIAYYDNLWKEKGYSKTIYHTTSAPITAPNYFKAEEFSPHILTISPDFVEIYNQALQAEHFNLHQIAGVGFRKALEFLIKDFLINQQPENEDEIKNKLLGKCVKMLGNSQLETVAQKATWLGNDQTHYVQKFTDRDITDLKRLVRLTVHWISMIIETEEAEQIQSQN